MFDSFDEVLLNLLQGKDPELIDIIEKTAQLCLSSSLISILIAIPIGICLGYFKFKGKKIIQVINNTLTGVPPVVCGLVCWILFSRAGLLGFLGILFTVKGMIVAQVLLITPVLIATIETFVSSISSSIEETAKGLKLSWFKTILLIMNESKYQIVSTYLLGFSRSMAEVGAVSMVGGAIAWHTNVMTTAIMQYTNMGYISYAESLGLILFVISLIFNIIVFIMQQRLKNDYK